MIKIINKENCSGCYACANACPKNCIGMEKDEEGFLYPKVNEDICVNCGLCEKACPVIAKNPFSANTDAYAVFNNNEKIRLQSSSGGIFTAIAESVILEGGAVFGAAFDENFNVKHICVDSAEELYKLRGSKYLQSTIGNTYKQVKTMLDNGREIYFTGTPCQVEGLLKYLDKEYDNLVTSDIICHGVPSPEVWQAYLKSKNESNVINATFRNKDLGWTNFSLKIENKDGKVYRKTLHEDSFMKAFLKNLCLRPSCYNCSFKAKNRASDLTLADFWGVTNVLPEMDDDKGTSLLLVHTKKGKEVLEKASQRLTLKAVDIDTALRYNSAATKSVIKPPKRDKFMQEVTAENFDNLVKRYSKRTFLQKVKSLIGRMIKI